MSLRARLVLAASFVLTTFIFIAGYTLDRAFFESAENHTKDNLNSQLTLLMGSAEVTRADDIDMPPRLLETKFSLPSSGLYAYILDSSGGVLWKSLSTVGISLPKPKILLAGEQELIRINHLNDEYYILSYGINWYTETATIPLTFNIISDLSSFNNQISNYRQTLWGWLVGLAIILVSAQVLILFWGLKPLQKVALEISAVESGKQDKIKSGYPKEIQVLTDNINVLIEHEHAQKQRYRNGLADLAHSLKTPLAVLHGAIDEISDDKATNTFYEQIQRMDHIVAHQLKRAATAGVSPISQSTNVNVIVTKLITALTKVYRDKNIKFEQQIPEKLNIRVDSSDLMEMLGNILDNACKWSHEKILISIESRDDRAHFTIEDDGVGVKPDQIEHILSRGGRLDQATPGQGIGLSVVVDIIHAYKGQITVKQSRWDGANFCFDLPLA